MSELDLDAAYNEYLGKQGSWEDRIDKELELGPGCGLSEEQYAFMAGVRMTEDRLRPIEALAQQLLDALKGSERVSALLRHPVAVYNRKIIAAAKALGLEPSK